MDAAVHLLGGSIRWSCFGCRLSPKNIESRPVQSSGFIPKRLTTSSVIVSVQNCLRVEFSSVTLSSILEQILILLVCFCVHKEDGHHGRALVFQIFSRVF